MKKILSNLIILCIINNLSAQDTTSINSNKYNRQHKITLENLFLLENTSLDGKLFTSGNIDSYKQTISSNLSENNVLAIQNRLGLSYTKKASKKDIGYSIGIYDRTEIDFAFSKNLFDLIFFGNKMFMGDIINLNNTSLSATRFQQINLALSKIININNSHNFLPEEIEIELGYSYLIGNTHLGFNTNNSYIEIGEDGSYINTELNFTANLSDTNDISPLNIFSQNGSGSAIDINVKLKKKENNLHIAVTDLGSINWKENSTSYSTNKIINNFTGIEIDNLLNINDSAIQNQLDSLAEINIIRKEETFRSYLATTFHLLYKRDLPTKYIDYLLIGRISKYRKGIIAANYKPKYYIGTRFSNKRLHMNTSFSIGGYSKSALGVELGQKIGKEHFQIIIGTQHLESYFKGLDISSLDFYFQLSFFFGKQMN